MRAGLLRSRATFQSRSRTSDGGGGAMVTWGGNIQVWAQYVPERGSERVEGGRIDAPLSGVLRVRSSSATRAIDESWSVVINDVRYQIRSIANPDQRNAMLEMVIEKGVAV